MHCKLMQCIAGRVLIFLHCKQLTITWDENSFVESNEQRKNHATHSYLKCIIADLAFIHWKWHFFFRPFHVNSLQPALASRRHFNTKTLPHTSIFVFLIYCKYLHINRILTPLSFFFLSSKLFFRRCCHNSFQFYSLEIVRSHSNMFKNVCKALRISSIHFFSPQRTFNSVL